MIFLARPMRQRVMLITPEAQICYNIEACKGLPGQAIRKKNSDSKVVRSPLQKTLLAEFFNTPVPLSTGIESTFSFGIKTFFVLSG